MSRPADPTAKDALTAAARAEFAKKGLRGARIEDITAACGLSKGAFYLHFESKEGLFKLLVEQFLGELIQCSEGRIANAEAFTTLHGKLTAADYRDHTSRLQSFTDLECEEDLRTLDAMWRYRDVLDVLISGCQGTTFEGTLWQILEAEQARVAENYRQLQGVGCCRADIPPELFGAMVIGTYLLVGKQMARAQDKPDLANLARTLQRLIREGSVPRGEAPRDRLSLAESVSRRQKLRGPKAKHPRSKVRSSS